MRRILFVSLVLSSVLASGTGLSGCGANSRPGGGFFPSDSGTGGGTDDMPFSFGDDAGHYMGPCDDQHPCSTGQRCYMDACIMDNGTCQSDEDCQNDSYCDCTGGGGGDGGPCMGGVCIPWGTGPKGAFDPTCQGPSFSPTDFKPPVQHCKWSDTGSRGWVIMTPLVVDLNGDGTPEIVFSPMGGGGGQYSQRIVAVRSKDCTVMFDQDVGLQGFSQLAVADLDGDKVPEIVGIDAAKKVKVYDNKGVLLATSPTPYNFSSGGSFDCSGPAIANVDGMGGPEIIAAGQVLRYTKGQAALAVLWTKPVTAAYWGTLSAAADLDADGKMEVIVGKEIFDGVTGADKTPANLKAIGGVGAYPAIADFNGDKKPDIVLVQSGSGMQSVSVFDYTNNKVIFGPYTVAGGGWGGPPTVADFDGDGVPDFGLSSSTFYYVYAMKCAQQNKPKDCTGTDKGVLWQKPTHDVSSGGTASSVFDFNGDGKAEVVYRDECWLRVYNGPDGKTVFAANITSGTALENPIIADVDNDGHAEIVVGSDDVQMGFSSCPTTPEAETKVPWTGYTRGLFVFKDPMNRWMPSRPLWNEHTYHITNINDDLTIPVTEKNNWLSWNDYRQNVQGIPGKPGALGDITGGVATGLDSGQADCSMIWTLKANMCNRGTAMLQAGIPGSFYMSDPRKGGAKPICTAVSTMMLGPGQCETLSCDWKMPPQTPTDLWFRGDDDGSGKMAVGECKTMNDVLFLPQAVCMKIQ